MDGREGMAAGTDEVWAWMSPPLLELREGRAADPDAHWSALEAQFLASLGLASAGEHPAVAALLSELDSMSDEERDALVAGEGLESMAYQCVERSGEPGGDTAGAEPGGYDEGAWVSYLQENLALWDGSEGSWEAFRDWFVNSAGTLGLAEPAASLTGYLDSLPNADRIAVCAQYGVTIVAPAGDGDPDQPASSGEPAEPAAGPDLSPQDEELISTVVEELPEFAAIPIERRRELLAELLQTEAASASSDSVSE